MRFYRFWFASLLSLTLFAGLGALPATAADSRILKVLPHFLDAQGRQALSPSLYERDAYQALLRKHPEQVSTLRFDIHWKAVRHAGGHPVLRLEVRTSKHQGTDVIVLEQPLPAKSSGGWTPLTLDRAVYRDAGNIQAWRATLRDGETQLAESKSFLW